MSTIKSILLYAFTLLLFVCSASYGQIIINEVSPFNTLGLQDRDDNVQNWLELFNTSDSTVYLENYYLSDDKSELQKWNFPEEKIKSGKYLIVFLSGEDIIDKELHTNFKIGVDEDLILSDNLNVIDSLHITKTPTNISLNKVNSVYNYFSIPTPDEPNNSGSSKILSPPTISPISGTYSTNITPVVTIIDTNNTIRYTIDGSEPTINSPEYTNETMLSLPIYTNGISLIPTNPSFSFPHSKYDSMRANSRGWLPPFSETSKCIVFKAKAFNDSDIPSTSSSAVYFPDTTFHKYTLPITSIVVDSSYFFNDEKGIYVYGNSEEGNYNIEGSASEVPINLTLFNSNGEVISQEVCGARAHGGGGRHAPFKSLKIFYREDYGNKGIKAPVFNPSIKTKHENLIVRSTGHRPNCIARDDLALSLTKDLLFDATLNYQSILFLNNEYWGIHNVREALDEEFFSIKYDIKEDDITILSTKGNFEKGAIEDTANFLNLIRFLETSQLSDSNVYLTALNQMDIENCIDYYCAEIFLGNGDWPYNNNKFWRNNSVSTPSADLPYEKDGRWRWIFYDLDGGYGGSCNGVYPTFNTLKRSLSTDENYVEYTRLFRALINNSVFKNEFILRMTDLLNSSFNYKHTSIVKDSVLSKYDPEILEHVKRWRYPSVAEDLLSRSQETPSADRWNTIKEELSYYLQVRPSYQFKHLSRYFLLEDTSHITLNLNDVNAGEIKVNSLVINTQLDAANATPYPWTGTYFNDIPIKITAEPFIGYKFLHWKEDGDTSISRMIQINSDSTFTAVFEIDDDYFNRTFSLKINEVSPLNDVFADENGQYDDWFELYNYDTEAVNLEGLYLSDNKNDLLKYSIPSSAEIQANGFLVFWCDKETFQGDLHTNFKLSSKGETIYLTDIDGITILDSLTFGVTNLNQSFGSFPDGSTDYEYFDYPTPGKGNLINGFNNESEHNNIEFYPNPSLGKLVIRNSKNESTVIRILNLQGEKLKELTIKSGQQTIELNNLKSGIYILEAHSNSTTTAQKFVITR